MHAGLPVFRPLTLNTMAGVPSLLWGGGGAAVCVAEEELPECDVAKLVHYIEAVKHSCTAVGSSGCEWGGAATGLSSSAAAAAAGSMPADLVSTLVDEFRRLASWLRSARLSVLIGVLTRSQVANYAACQTAAAIVAPAVHIAEDCDAL